MYITLAKLTPAAGLPDNPTCPGNVPQPSNGGNTVADALAAFEPAGAQAAASARGKRDAGRQDFTIERVGSSVKDLVDSDRVRAELDKVVDAIKRLDVREVEIKAYAPFFKEVAKPRAQAVRDYLVLKGVDKDVITLSPRGPGYGSKHASLARTRSVVIEVTGSPKAAMAAEALPDSAARVARPSPQPEFA